MSLRDLANTTSSIDDFGDQPTDGGNEPPPPVRASDALANAMLDDVLTPRLRRLLTSPSSLIVIKTTDAAMAELLDRHLNELEKTRIVEAFSEPHKSGGKLEPRGRAELRMLERGQSVILISQDPERILVPEALATADAVIDVSAPGLAVVRKVIRAVTGKNVRGLQQADINGLSIHEIIAAIRPNLSPRQCLNNLRRGAQARQAPTSTSTAIPLEDLALTKIVSNWAFETLRVMGKVAGGELDASALPYACLEGPPGCGKTTLASSLAHSAGWTFVGTSVGSWFAESGGHLGDVIRAARKFFDALALAGGPVVGLIDEIDSLPSRAAIDADHGSWWTPVITFVLTEIDRLRKSGRPILLIAATNHGDRLDTALTRAGRLERRVSVLLPDEGERRAMFGKLLGDRIEAKGLATLARLAVEATPAQIGSWCGAAIAAAQSRNRSLSLRDLVELIAPSGQRSTDLDRAIALHEAGHAIAARELDLPVLEISIIGAADGVGGWVNTRLDDRLMTRDRVERLATVMLAGRAADTVLGHGPHAGAANDIENVNALLRAAMLDFGLYGSLTNGSNTDLRNFEGPGMSFWSVIRAETKRALDRATKIVDHRRDDIFKLVDILLVERVVTGDGLTEILTTDTPDTDPEVDSAAYPVRRP